MVRFSGFSETKTDDCVSLLMAMRPPVTHRFLLPRHRATSMTTVPGSLRAAFSKVTSVWPDECPAPWMRRSTNPGFAWARFFVASTARAWGEKIRPSVVANPVKTSNAADFGIP